MCAHRHWQGLDTSEKRESHYRDVRSLDTGHEVVMNREMRAWLARFDAKGALIVIDTCYDRATREVDASAGRSLAGIVDEAFHGSFTGCPWSLRARWRRGTSNSWLARRQDERSGSGFAHPDAPSIALWLSWSSNGPL
jgi:hypothetical protein